MSTVIIAIGSNCLQAIHVQWATEKISCIIDGAVFSRRLWTEDIHQKGKYYQNRLVKGFTTLSVDEVVQKLKAIEVEAHRDGNRVTIDLDLMQYDYQRYHQKDWPRQYIQLLLPDILKL